MIKPLLIFGWGNPSRGDDALGPRFVEALRPLVGAGAASRIDLLDDYQLQVEHALDLVGREHVLFVDASIRCAAPFEVSALRAARDTSFTTHALSPASVMQVFRELRNEEPPPCTLLAIRGDRFNLGEAPQPEALLHLTLAVEWGLRWVSEHGG